MQCSSKGWKRSIKCKCLKCKCFFVVSIFKIKFPFMNMRFSSSEAWWITDSFVQQLAIKKKSCMRHIPGCLNRHRFWRVKNSKIPTEVLYCSASALPPDLCPHRDTACITVTGLKKEADDMTAAAASSHSSSPCSAPRQTAGALWEHRAARRRSTPPPG